MAPAPPSSSHSLHIIVSCCMQGQCMCCTSSHQLQHAHFLR